MNIPAGKSSTSFSIEIFDDRHLENDEMFELSISSLPGGILFGSISNVTVVIVDNDGKLISLIVSDLLYSQTSHPIS